MKFIKSKKYKKSNLWMSGAAACLLTSLLYAPVVTAVVPNDNFTPEDIQDDEDSVTGVGMFFRNDGGLCTGTLINPRTVIFAAHCVNNRPESDYGPTIQSVFSFNGDAFPGLIDWFLNGNVSNPDLLAYNVRQILYHPDSLTNPDALGFLEADIALAVLDTPAANIPTWALLFSRLPNPETQNSATGTGYHVNITGYGRTGSGTTGASQPIDFRRRSAENMLGVLSSFDVQYTFFFGDTFGDLPQNLYVFDFDDPDKNSTTDIDLHQDEALTNEGITAGGDSGGPLILDAANNSLNDDDLLLGVLSGGFSPFNVDSSYGNASFYQPVYLFADYIAANNPYRYVSAMAGDGAWEDPSHWQTDHDPNYRIIDSDGEVVVGFPDTQPFGTEPDGDSGFGVICVDFEGVNEGDRCQDVSTGDPVPPSRETVGEEERVTNNAWQLTDEELNTLGLNARNDAAGGVVSSGESQEQNQEQNQDQAQNDGEHVSQAGGDPLPAPTIENGLAGATDFVPDNIDPPVGSAVRRYFDVRLTNDGITTLSSTRTIDRLTVSGEAGLIIGSEGHLNSLIDMSQWGGRVVVDGTLNSVGDYSLFMGMLSGIGTVTAPFVTNIAGTIVPGSMGVVGELTIDGNAVLSSGSNLLIDLGANGVNDVLTITGDTSLGGNVIFMAAGTVLAGNEYTFLTTAGTQTEAFTSSTGFNSVLRPVLTHNENSVMVTIEAGSYFDAIETGNAVQSSYAQLLDESRDYGLGGLYASLDLLSDAQIQGVLESWAPVTETTTRSLARTSVDSLARFHRNRMTNFGSKDWGGKVTVMGSPVQMASNAQYATSLSDTASLEASNGTPVVKQTRSIPSDYAIYLAGSFIDGQGGAMPTTQNYGDEDFDGWSVSGGIEHYVSENVSLGASLSYSQLEADAALGQVAESDHIVGTLYGQLRDASNVVLDGQISIGSFGAKTSRTVAFPSNNTLKTDDNSLTLTADLQISKAFDVQDITLSPKASLRNTLIDFDTVSETGGLPGLTIHRDKLVSTQGRIGADLETSLQSSWRVRLSGEVVRELGNIEDSVKAGFRAGPTNRLADFALFGTDKTWGEIGANVQFDLGQAKIDLSADTTVGRQDIEARTYRAGVTYKF